MFSDFHPRSRLLYFALALLGAIALWYTVNAREQVERVIEVRLDYKGLPPGLVITKGQLNKISVRLRGPLELLRSASNRDLYHTLDLSNLSVGSNVIPLNTDTTPVNELRGFQVVEVIPQRLNFDVDRILEVRLPVEARLRESSLSSSIKLTKVLIQPETVTVRGPAAEVSKLQKVLVELPVTLENEDQEVTEDLSVVAPPTVEVSPSTVRVQRSQTIQRRTISLQRDIILDTSSNVNLNLTPSRVSLRISVPSGAFKDAAYLAQIQASLEPESALERLAELTPLNTQANTTPSLLEPVKISLPPGARLISVNPEKVRLSLTK